MAAAKRRGHAAGRLLFMLIALFAGLSVIGGRLFWMQTVASDRFIALGQDQRERKVVLPPQRGSILDRAESELAISVDRKTIYANPRFVPDPQRAAAQLGPIVGVEPGILQNKLSSGAGFVYLARKIDPAVADKVKQLKIPGVDVISESKRFYPAGQLASHVTGFVGFNNQGLGGLESSYEKFLAGSPGEILTERDPRGRAIASGRSLVKPSTPGGDLVLTLDRQIQFTAEVALAKAIKTWRAKGGSIVVMDPRTGEVLAMANLPTYDPNNVKGSEPADRKNRALLDVYEPGSANKVITAAAALETGVTSPGQMMSVQDKIRIGAETIHDSHAHPTQTLSFAEVIQQSSNTGTIKVALSLGKDRLYDYLLRFGYGRPTALAFPGETGGIVPRPEKWWGTSVGTIPIGQGVAVSTMQIMGVFSTLANNGVLVEPKLVKAVIDSNGNQKPTAPSPSRRVVEQTTAAQVSNILVGVTEGAKGTGKLAAIPGYQVAGKTGTAQKVRQGAPGYSGYMASFIGFAPANNPALVAGVILDDPRPIYGAETAAPIFNEVMNFSLRHLGIGPGPVLPPEGTPLPAPARSGGAA